MLKGWTGIEVVMYYEYIDRFLREILNFGRHRGVQGNGVHFRMETSR